jgi:hypothetical protein
MRIATTLALIAARLAPDTMYAQTGPRPTSTPTRPLGVLHGVLAVHELGTQGWFANATSLKPGTEIMVSWRGCTCALVLACGTPRTRVRIEWGEAFVHEQSVGQVRDFIDVVRRSDVFIARANPHHYGAWGALAAGLGVAVFLLAITCSDHHSRGYSGCFGG